jgi:hypothetical protein
MDCAAEALEEANDGGEGRGAVEDERRMTAEADSQSKRGLDIGDGGAEQTETTDAERSKLGGEEVSGDELAQLSKRQKT